MRHVLATLRMRGSSAVPNERTPTEVRAATVGAQNQPGCSYRGEGPNTALGSHHYRPNVSHAQKKAGNDIFPETETMFPLLLDSRFGSSLSNHALDSPPDVSRKSSAKSSPVAHWQASKLPLHKFASDLWRSSHSHGQAKKSMTGGFFKRIFWGSPRKYFMPPESKESSAEPKFSEVLMRYHQQSPETIPSVDANTAKRNSQRLADADVVHPAPPPSQRKKKITPNDSKMVYAKILQDALINQDPNTSALVVTPDPETGWFLVSFHVWFKHQEHPLKEAISTKRFQKPGATYFVHGGTGTLQ